MPVIRVANSSQPEVFIVKVGVELRVRERPAEEADQVSDERTQRDGKRFRPQAQKYSQIGIIDLIDRQTLL